MTEITQAAVQHPTTIREEVFSLHNCEMVLQWPQNISPAEAEELEDWFALVRRKIRRAAGLADGGAHVLPDSAQAEATYAALLHLLHALMHAGHADSPVTDEVRDLMDGPERRLDDTARDRMQALSGLLYRIADQQATAATPEQSA